MHKIIVMMCLLTAILTVSAYAAEPPSSPHQKSSNIQVHGTGEEKNNLTMLDVLKKQKLKNYPGATIGKAFDGYSYFSRVEWKQYADAGAKNYFDFTGRIKKPWFEFGSAAARYLEVKFLITSDGDYGVVMATKVSITKDGKTVKNPVTDMKALLDAIYANREIKF